MDIKTGFRTRAILCMPIFNHDKEVLAVLQIMNKSDEGVFSKEDEEILESLLAIAGPILQESPLFLKKKTNEVETGDAVNLPVNEKAHASVLSTITE